LIWRVWTKSFRFKKHLKTIFLIDQCALIMFCPWITVETVFMYSRLPGLFSPLVFKLNQQLSWPIGVKTFCSPLDSIKESSRLGVGQNSFLLAQTLTLWGQTSHLGSIMLYELRDRGRRYNNFLRFSLIICEKLAFISKTNVMIKLLKNASISSSKKRQFFRRFFCQKYFKNHNIGPRKRTRRGTTSGRGSAATTLTARARPWGRSWPSWRRPSRTSSTKWTSWRSRSRRLDYTKHIKAVFNVNALKFWFGQFSFAQNFIY
jgi:hypothetical protein